MPGIAGIVGIVPRAADALAEMVSCLLHEPWYASGTYGSPELGCHVGWASHRDSFCDGMPLWNDARDICLVFTGEDFSDPAKRDVPQNGTLCTSDGVGASYLVRMYEEQGAAFVARLNGWFSGIVIDLRKRIVLLFNDRYGLNRIYWRQKDGALYFASEAKSLLRLFPDARSLDEAAVAETFSCGCVLQGRSLFRGLSLLPPGSLWSWDASGRIDKQTYFTPSEWEDQSVLDDATFYERLKATFAGLLPRYFRGPGQSGMSLTGGLDGRMIMAWAGRRPGELPCYSFGGSYRECRDVRIARQIAGLCGQPHTTIGVGSEFLANFPALASRTVCLSDGTMDVSGAVELYVNRRARDIATTRMTGNYGSEIVRANVAFRPRRLDPELFDPAFFARIGQAAETYAGERRVQDISFVAFKQVPWHHYSRLSVEQSQLTLRSPFLDNDLVALMYRASPAVLTSKIPSLRLIHDGNPTLARLPTDRGLIYGVTSIGDRIRNMVQEFMVRAEYAYDYGMPNWLARTDHALAPLGLERFFLGRHKFYHFRNWYKHELAPYVREILLDRRTRERSFFRPGILERFVQDHVSGRANHTLEIHRALTLELAQRELLDRPAGVGGDRMARERAST